MEEILRLYLKNLFEMAIDKPRIKHLEVLPLWGCNAKCPTCGSWKRPDNVRLSKKQAEAIVNYPFKRLEKVVIEGGEPTMWEHLIWFTKNMIQRTKITEYVIITNGINVENIKHLGESLKECQPILRWNVSFNGIGKTHDYSRGTKEAFEKTSASVQNLVKQGYEVRLSFAPFAKNYKEYEDVIKYAKTFGVQNVGVCYPTVSTKFGENLKAKVLDKDEFDKFYRNYLKKYCKGGWKWACHYFHEHVIRKKLMPCYGAQTFINVLPNGLISPCCFREDGIVGKVTDNEMILYKDKRKAMKKELKKAECAYNDRTVCGDCFLVHTIRHNVPRLAMWKLFHPKI